MSVINKKSSQHSATTMDPYLIILEEPQPKSEGKIDEEKLRFIASKIAIWDFFGIRQSTYFGIFYKGKIKNVQ